jgi:hypothetical protein
VPDDTAPSAAALRLTEALFALLSADPFFSRVRRLMEVDWSEADTTIEEIGLPRLLRQQAYKLWALLPAGSTAPEWCDVADAIRYSERHDGLARDALWWLGELSRDPLLSTPLRG